MLNLAHLALVGPELLVARNDVQTLESWDEPGEQLLPTAEGRRFRNLSASPKNLEASSLKHKHLKGEGIVSKTQRFSFRITGPEGRSQKSHIEIAESNQVPKSILIP